MTNTANLNAPCTLQLYEPKPSESSFENAIMEAIDESLSSLGCSGKQAIYFHLEHAFRIKKQEIPCKIEDFAEAIKQVFGVGARLIEMRIIKALHERVQDFVYVPRKGDIVFTEYVANLHR